MTEVKDVAQEQERSVILGNAKTPFEHVMTGSGYEQTDLQGNKIRINPAVLRELVAAGKFYISEDFFWPLGRRDGSLSAEQVTREREKFPTEKSFLFFAIFTDDAFDVALQDKFDPELRLAPPDPKQPELTIRELRMRLVHQKDSRIGPPFGEFRKFKLREGYEDLFTLKYPELGQDFLTIGINPHAMHGARADIK